MRAVSEWGTEGEWAVESVAQTLAVPAPSESESSLITVVHCMRVHCVSSSLAVLCLITEGEQNASVALYPSIFSQHRCTFIPVRHHSSSWGAVCGLSDHCWNLRVLLLQEIQSRDYEGRHRTGWLLWGQRVGCRCIPILLPFTKRALPHCLASKLSITYNASMDYYTTFM